MEEIELSKGKFAMVDDDDFEYLSQFKWFLDPNGYAMANIKINGRWEKKRMHTLILKSIDNMIIDHINRDKLDNRKDNLRYATYSENFHNVTITKRNKSGYKGVYWDKGSKKWRAMASINGKQKHLGLFEDKKEAARKYNEVVKETCGDFAYLNKV